MLNLPKDPSFEQIYKIIDLYNGSYYPDSSLISSVYFSKNFELDRPKYIYISIDEIGVQQQKFNRNNEELS